MFVERLNDRLIADFARHLLGLGVALNLDKREEGTILYIENFFGIKHIFLLEDFSITPLNGGAISCVLEHKNLNLEWRKYMSKFFGKEYIEKYKKKCMMETIKMNDNLNR